MYSLDPAQFILDDSFLVVKRDEVVHLDALVAYTPEDQAARNGLALPGLDQLLLTVHVLMQKRREDNIVLKPRTPEDYDKRSVLSSPESDDLTPAWGGEGNAKERKKTRGVKCRLPRPGLQEVYSVSQLCSGSHGIKDLEKSK